ncbi:hypothetical protein B0H10DRAFT_1988754 [Mycena sp. CBHHK59/15]|nr:hypothetical protein B0H10DRAFT_1988754 [Mycena sp. CBHHK59/15]
MDRTLPQSSVLPSYLLLLAYPLVHSSRHRCNRSTLHPLPRGPPPIFASACHSCSLPLLGATPVTKESIAAIVYRGD